MIGVHYCDEYIDHWSRSLVSEGLGPGMAPNARARGGSGMPPSSFRIGHIGRHPFASQWASPLTYLPHALLRRQQHVHAQLQL